ncbi:MAG: amidohydrolase family protein [Erythrobacter sp.]|nr:amidohydrolase family protein [Erythrobacter sp.]
MTRWALAALLLVAAAQASAQVRAIVDVTVIDVEDGTERAHQTVVLDGETIHGVGPAEDVRLTPDVERIDGAGRFLIPGLWDMHVHAHRAGRWAWHYPLYRAFGVVGVRDAGTHLGSALAWRQRAAADPMAPHVVWGSPIIDGAPQFNSFGLSAEDEEAGRQLVRLMQQLGFDFVKVYDRLTPDAYRGIADEAMRVGIPVEGHVPLALSPADAVLAHQRLIDHLTLVLEACVPGALDMVHAERAAHPEEVDSLALLMDPRLVARLPEYDRPYCDAQFRAFAEHDVWQVPTLVQMYGFFHADDPAVTADPRSDTVPPAVLAQWHGLASEEDPVDLANGRAVLAAQMAMIRPMQDAGVGLLAGTDASTEAWVFPGSGLHDELALLVQAGLTPAEALRTATLNPLVYQSREPAGRVIAVGEPADLVLLDADPLAAIGNSRAIAAVFARGLYHDRAALDALVEQARLAARQ